MKNIKFQAPCINCIAYVMCLSKEEISCSILKDFYLHGITNPKMRKYKSLYRDRIDAIQKALHKVVLDYGFDGDNFWLSLFPVDDIIDRRF